MNKELTERCGTRCALSPYIGKFILAKGWIEDWKDLKDVRRYYISQPTIKKADKNTRWDELETISTEHHINLFIPKEDLYSVRGGELKMYESVSFAGIIKKYTRKDGSYDWGVKTLPQSNIEYTLQKMKTYVMDAANANGRYSREFLMALEFVIKKNLKELEQHLEDAGDLLPTFDGTYSSYKDELKHWMNCTDDIIRYIRCSCSNRRLRRKHKIPYNFAAEIPAFQ